MIKIRGISLIVLVITIVVIVILAGAVIFSIVTNNPLDSARAAQFKSSVNEYEQELSVFLANEYISKSGIVDINAVNASKTIKYDNKLLNDIITSMTTSDLNLFEIRESKLVYVGSDSQQIQWCIDIGINVSSAGVTFTSDYINSEGVNKPKLALGMTAIKYNTGTSQWDTVTDPDNDTTWYSYNTTDKQWANAKTADGSYWVWIPRFIYKITSGWHSTTTGNIEIQFSKHTSDNWNNLVIGDISADTTANASNNVWTNHPAFTFGSTELTGIWVAKFRATAREALSGTMAGDNVTTKNVKILPASSVWKNIYIGNQFEVVRKMETDSTYGWGTSGLGINTHLMKNVEWGAVVYLGKSGYGKNAKVTLSSTTTSAIASTDQSTTGNQYGVYDFGGEYLAAYVDNANTSLINYGNQLVSADTAYKDVYLVTTDSSATNLTNAINKKGDGVYEITSATFGPNGWFGDYTGMPYTGSPYFYRNNNFGFSYDSSATPTYGFRPVLSVNSSFTDKVAPTIEIGTNGASNISTASTTVTASDTGGSGLNASKLQYSWDIQNTSLPFMGWTTFTNGSTITKSNFEGVQYLWIKAVDNAGNVYITKSNAFIAVAESQANAPLLATGMTAKKWNSSTSAWDTVSNPTSDTSWYNYGYSAKMWANAQTADGSMWVWIPRYIYKITSGWHSTITGNIEIQFSQGINDNWNSSSIGMLNSDTSANASNNSWTNHPAFTFGSTELTGIWVAKFRATAREALAGTMAGDNVTTKNVKILPASSVWKNIYIGNQFEVIRKMETDSTYGWGTSGLGIDTHLMKNVEWGAVVYLGRSGYGKYTKVATSTNATTSAITSIDQSTTGNQYGVYDFGGEYFAAYVNNANANLTSYGNQLVSANTAYKDVYLVTTDSSATNLTNAINKKGDGVYEITSATFGAYGWFVDYTGMPSTSGPFFYRNNNFGFSYDSSANPVNGFRPVLLINGAL